MKNLIIYTLLVSAIIACKSKPQNTTTDSTKTKAVPLGYSGSLDLAKLKLQENVPALMAAQKIKLEHITDSDRTLLGYDRVKSYDAKALQYSDVNLAGVGGGKKNYVLFHYDENTKKLAFFEVEVCNRAQVEALNKQLDKLGKPAFTKNWPDATYTLDENGNAVKPDPDDKGTSLEWKNKQTGLTYFYNIDRNPHHYSAHLTVLNRADKAGKDWLSLTELDILERM